MSTRPNTSPEPKAGTERTFSYVTWEDQALPEGENRRRESRVFVGLLVRVRYQDVSEFIDYYATNISSGGIFIQSRRVYPKDTLLKFEIKLKGGQTVLQGRGVVAWTREPSQPDTRPQVPGMGVRFLHLDASSKQVVKRIIDGKKKRIAIAQTKMQEHNQAEVDIDSIDVEIEAPPEMREPTIQVEAGLQAESFDCREEATKLGPRSESNGSRRISDEERQNAANVIGIDLGTTNSCASVVIKDRPQVIPSRKGYHTIPSVVAYDEKGHLLVGHQAKAQMELNPANTVYGSKRLIGRPFSAPKVRNMRDRFHYDIVEGPKHECAVQIAGRVFSLQQIAAFILSDIRDIARDLLGFDVKRAVITVPAYYNENQRQAVRQAGTLAGLHVERILNEPTAAALAFGYNRGLDQRVMIYDLGGGTFDVSVMELTENVYEVVATGGEAFLGGVDFDNQIVDYLIQSFINQVGVVPELESCAMQRLRNAAEQAKCALSEKSETIVRIPFLCTINNTPKDLEVRLSRIQLEELVGSLVDRTIEVALQVSSQAGWTPDHVDHVLLVGGQSRMPLIRARIQEVFGIPPHKGVHPDEAVAIGAALMAASIERIDAVVLIDVLPISIGLGLPGGAFLPIIQSGSSLPVKKTYTISTFREQQTQMELIIFQGEHARVVNNEYLSTLCIDNIPQGPKGANQLEITFSLDQECLLQASVRNLNSQQPLRFQLVNLDTADTVRQKLSIVAEEQPIDSMATTMVTVRQPHNQMHQDGISPPGGTG